MMRVVLRVIVLLRLALLGLAIYWICSGYLLLGLVVLIVTYPLWEILIYELRPLGPNWRKVKRGKCYNHSSHEFTLDFRNEGLAADLDGVYDRLKNFDDFDGKMNRIARKRGRVVRGVKYIYFDSLGFFGLMSVLINPPSIPVRVWSQRKDHLVVGDTASGHMLKGQRRWQANKGEDGRITVLTWAHEQPRNLVNRIGLVVIGADRQEEVWTSYFENMRLHYADRATSTEVTVTPVAQVELPAVSPPGVAWVPKATYPGMEV